jgi:hypothetical protein
MAALVHGICLVCARLCGERVRPAMARAEKERGHRMALIVADLSTELIEELRPQMSHQGARQELGRSDSARGELDSVEHRRGGVLRSG